jgi:predicted dehydrogenase
VAIVGAGRWGRNIIRVLSQIDGARLVVACDRNARALEGLSADVEREYSSDRVFCRPDIDAVLIATPPNTHADLTVAALRAKKHVFVEKPMAMRTADAVRIKRAATESDRRVMVGFILHHHPAVIALQTLIRSGRLGSISSIRAVRAASRPPTLEHPLWWSLAPHDASLALSLVGSAPQAISVAQHRIGDRETLTATVTFSSSVQLEMEVSSQPGPRRFEVRGTAATAIFDGLASARRLVVRDSVNGSAEDVVLCATEPLAAELAHFMECLTHARDFSPALDHAIDVVNLLELGERSCGLDGSTETVGTWRVSSRREDAQAAASVSVLDSSRP